ncbi:Receptor-type tyrosine-protein phosphatase gamma [Aphelenchoides bicaudatus]|nr:Receptor-type tyrosine-protein phosphatase gamma [Aphelenchoides bicaudatus]
MDELALIFLLIGLGLVLIVFLVIGLVIYTWQRSKRRRVHIENVAITNKSFDSQSKYSKSDSSDYIKSSRSPGLALTHHFHHEFGIPKKTFEAPSAPLSGQLTPPSSSSSSDGITDAEFSTAKTLEAKTNGGSLRSVIIIDSEPEQKVDEMEEVARKSTEFLKNADTIVLPILVPIQRPETAPPTITRERVFPLDISNASPRARHSFSSDVTPRRFSRHMEQVQEHENERLYAEFDNLNQQVETEASNEGQTLKNIRKNRYYDILPYDNNRVKLVGLPTDYVNASYIHGEDGSAQYIAAQGPIGDDEAIGGRRDSTISKFLLIHESPLKTRLQVAPRLLLSEDFWHMIWQERVDCIVMLSQCVEHHRKKCAQYWPKNADENEQIDDELSMNLYCYTEDDICVQREIWLEKKNEGTRKIIQWHYKNWNDAQGPASNEDFLAFIDNVRKSSKRAPILVHCSAGIGRSGVYIGLDILLNKLEAESIIDVYETVQNMRKSRPNMIQNYDQYMALYELIAMAIRNKISQD